MYLNTHFTSDQVLGQYGACNQAGCFVADQQYILEQELFPVSSKWANFKRWYNFNWGKLKFSFQFNLSIAQCIILIFTFYSALEFRYIMETNVVPETFNEEKGYTYF